MSNYTRLFQLIDNTPATNLTGGKSKRNPVLILLRGMKQKTFGFVPVRYLYVHTCVLTVIPHRKLRLTNSKSKTKGIKCK